MKLIIAGSRDLTVTETFLNEIVTQFQLEMTEVVSGGARGIDRCGERFVGAFNNHFKGVKEINLKVFEADWETHGKAAGPIRNKEMAEYADALLLIHTNTKGSLSMKQEMQRLNKPIYEIILNVQNITKKEFTE